MKRTIKSDNRLHVSTVKRKGYNKEPWQFYTISSIRHQHPMLRNETKGKVT
jgi:hypothetical protein